MPVVAMGQEYFAEQTRRQEINDELAELPEDQLRLLRRSQMNVYNTQLLHLLAMLALFNRVILRSFKIMAIEDCTGTWGKGYSSTQRTQKEPGYS